MRPIGFHHLIRSLRYSQYTQRRFMAETTAIKPVETSIKQKLQDTFQPRNKVNALKGASIKERVKTITESSPAVLDVINESGMHSVPKGSETHFKVVVVTDKFESMPIIKRHRLVNETLKTELESGVHALSIVAKTPKQWEDTEGKVPKSPACQGGAGL